MEFAPLSHFSRARLAWCGMTGNPYRAQDFGTSGVPRAGVLFVAGRPPTTACAPPAPAVEQP